MGTQDRSSEQTASANLRVLAAAYIAKGQGAEARAVAKSFLTYSLDLNFRPTESDALSR